MADTHRTADDDVPVARPADWDELHHEAELQMQNALALLQQAFAFNHRLRRLEEGSDAEKLRCELERQGEEIARLRADAEEVEQRVDGVEMHLGLYGGDGAEPDPMTANAVRAHDNDDDGGS